MADTPALTPTPTDLILDEAVSVDVSDAFDRDAPLVGGAAAAPIDPFAAFDDSDVEVSGGTAPIVRATMAWDGADPWAAIGLAPPRPEDSVRLLGVIVRSLVERGLLDVRTVADALVPTVENPRP